MDDRKKALTAILGPDSPNVGKKGDGQGPEKPDPEQMLHALGEETLHCIVNKDVQGFLEGLRALFEEFDSEPHGEGDHY